MNTEGLGLKFNCVYKVVALTFDGRNYIPVESLDEYQVSLVEELKRDAYQNLNELVPVNNSTTPYFSLPSSIHQMPPYSFPALCLEPNGVPVTDQAYQKHHTPALEDPVWRLRKIAKGGAFHKRLNERGIDTVKEFLQQYHIDAQSLREILGNNVSKKAWEAITGHANACQLDNQQLYAYMNTEGLGLKFNCVYKVVAVTFDGRNYIPVESLDVYQMSLVEELKRDAYQNLNELVPVNNSTTPYFSLPSSIHQMPPYSFPALCLEPNGVPVTDQGRMNFDQDEPSASFSYLNDDVTHPCESSAFPARGSQPMQTMSAISALAMQDSPMNALGGASEWTPISTRGASPLDDGFFDNEIYPFQASSLPAATSGNWDQGTDLFTVFSLGRHMTAVDMSGSGSPRARWCKLRAAIKWKIVKRSAAAKRKGKLPFYYSY
ncbi:Calmodulin-binding protein 60 B-like protein [Drosera capensis]